MMDYFYYIILRSHRHFKSWCRYFFKPTGFIIHDIYFDFKAFYFKASPICIKMMM